MEMMMPEIYRDTSDEASPFEIYAKRISEICEGLPDDEPDNVVAFPTVPRKGNGAASKESCLEAALSYVKKYNWKVFPAVGEDKKSYLSAEYAPGTKTGA